MIWFLLLCVLTLSHSNDITIVQTCRDTLDKLSTKASIQFSNTQKHANLVVHINSSRQFQQILGFGGAFTESSAHVFSTLSPQLQEFVINSYWGSSGLEYSLGRITIGSSDYALSTYTYAEISGDFSLQHFSIEHDQQKVIPFIKAAIQKRNNTMKLVASPWSPPAWMKTNGNLLGSGSPCLRPDENGKSYQATWANYISKFITSYQSEEIPIWAITPQNEPENNAAWESCIWTPSEQKSFIKNHLGPQIKGDHPDVKILMYDHNRDHIVNWANTVLSDPSASQFVDGIAFHAYNGFLWDNLKTTHQNFPSKFLIATESARCHLDLGQWYWAEKTARDMIGDLNSWTVGFIDWNLILFTNGGPLHAGSVCNALLMYNPDSRQMIVNPAYYTMGQITKFVPPGSTVIYNSAMTSTEGVLVTSVLTPDNKIVVIVLNVEDNPKSLVLIKENGSSANYTVEKRSITTFVYNNEN